MSSLLDGLSKQSETEAKSNVDGSAEEGLHHALAVDMYKFASSSNSKDPKIPNNFQDSIKHKHWRDAIDREYNALRDRQTCTYLNSTSEMNVIPITWVFRLKPLDLDGQRAFQQAR